MASSYGRPRFPYPIFGVLFPVWWHFHRSSSVCTFILCSSRSGSGEDALLSRPCQTKQRALSGTRQRPNHHMAGRWPAGTFGRQSAGSDGVGKIHGEPSSTRLRLWSTPHLGRALEPRRAFTAGWNLCYMPYWAGMLTEEQHQHPELKKAIQQASWELYFRENPVCEPPDFVEDPGLNIEAVMDGQPLRVLVHTRSTERIEDEHITESIKRIRKDVRQSWSNIRKAVRSLRGMAHEPFGTSKVESTSKSCVRRICRETGLTLAELDSELPRP